MAKKPSAASASNSTADPVENSNVGPFLALPTASGASCYVRADTVDAVEPIDNTSCHIVVDGMRLMIRMDADDAAEMISQAL